MFEESVASIPSIWASMNSWFTPTIFFLLLNLMIGTIYVTSSLATASPKHTNDHEPRLHPQLVRSPSMLQRLKSINFYTHRSQEPTSQFAHHEPDLNTHFASHFEEPEHQQEPRALTRSPSMLQRLKSINLYSYMSQESSPPPSSRTDTVSAPQETYTQDESEVEEAAQELEPSLEEIYSQLQESGHVHVSRTKSDTKPASGEMPAKLARKMRKSASVKSPFLHFEEEEEVVEVRRPATVREGKVTEADEEVDAKADDFINKFKQQLKLQRMDSIIRYKEMIGRGSSDK